MRGRQNERRRLRIGGADLDVLLESCFGKQRCQMLGPVVDRGAERPEPLAQEAAERNSPRFDVLAVAQNEIHGDVEGVLGVRVEQTFGVEGEGKDPAAIGIGVGPNVRAVALVPGRTPVDDRGVRACGDEDRGQRHCYAELTPRVGFVHVV